MTENAKRRNSIRYIERGHLPWAWLQDQPQKTCSLQEERRWETCGKYDGLVISRANLSNPSLALRSHCDFQVPTLTDIRSRPLTTAAESTTKYQLSTRQYWNPDAARWTQLVDSSHGAPLLHLYYPYLPYLPRLTRRFSIPFRLHPLLTSTISILSIYSRMTVACSFHDRDSRTTTPAPPPIVDPAPLCREFPDPSIASRRSCCAIKAASTLRLTPPRPLSRLSVITGPV
ncbi:hypothetical protein B0H66DRAFT_144268 [Apodospora peruviana]|uniref:Uncharacterized protein n=1 Tax=Apodospora peruviana TaxID=516989 RepID=A0AAE0IJA1_9PEZI|nr:hypothetical protein B0H66DRAFT_144268 [Apodospora peruviana]